MTTLGEDLPPTVRETPALVEDFVVYAFDEAGLSERLVTGGVRLAFELADLDRTVVLDLPQQRIDAEVPSPVAARIRIQSSDLNRYLQGDLNLMAAIGEGAVEVSGAIVRALAAIGPRVEQLRQQYRAVLVAHDRTDLLV